MLFATNTTLISGTSDNKGLVLASTMMFVGWQWIYPTSSCCCSRLKGQSFGVLMAEGKKSSRIMWQLLRFLSEDHIGHFHSSWRMKFKVSLFWYKSVWNLCFFFAKNLSCKFVKAQHITLFSSLYSHGSAKEFTRSSLTLPSMLLTQAGAHRWDLKGRDQYRGAMSILNKYSN